MAYKNLLAEDLDASSEIEWTMRMRDFVCKQQSVHGGWDYRVSGIGWTLHDSSYAVDSDHMIINDWFVVYSAGEVGVDAMYYKITLINDYITIHGWQYWNSGTHTGSGIEYARDNAMEIGADPEQIWIYGDLDFVHLVAVGVDGNTNWYNGAFGLLATPWIKNLEGVSTNRNVQVCASTLTAGAGVSIVVPDTSSNLWRVGNNLMIMDNTYFEMITIISNNGSTTITANLVNSYSANARIAVSFPYFVTGQNTTHFYRSGYCVALHDMAGNHAGGVYEPVAISQIVQNTVFNLNIGGSTTWNSAYSINPYCVYDATNGYIGDIPHSGYTVGTGLVTNDVCDDITDPTLQWRYNSFTNPRFIKELK